ncbi:hypothetical protein FAZ79_00020 [Guyparkeria sp. SB14A]|uniref:ApeA N-terminal domain 1-containing protein n=1 Tax=Guyparkeria sp. SB14A TaxID=2571147 RepID=UPI0010AD2534|nr:HEPN domain-containing protein [Guyparkeria sp. SB14A]TKA91731.1 hypothetical protein FAZ79_00020 [Guyparkeria sp. SB14A]
MEEFCESKNVTGEFFLGEGRKVFGNLRICGRDTSLKLFDSVELPKSSEQYSYITGLLHDGNWVSLHGNVLLGVSSYFRQHVGLNYSADIFPHCVAMGPSLVPDSDDCVQSVSFVMKDASSVFYEFDSFSSVTDPEPFIPLLENDAGMDVKFGCHPIIAYFSGKFEIAVVQTSIGEIRTDNIPSHDLGGPDGVRIDNYIAVTIKPDEPLSLQESMRRLRVVLRFFGLVIGREQGLSHLNIVLQSDEPKESLPVAVYRTMEDVPPQEEGRKNHRPHPRDILVSTLDGPEDYSNLLRAYLRSDEDCHDARVRLQNSLRNSNSYTIDRLVGAANMFDILPDKMYPNRVELSPELAEAKKEAKQLFKSLPDSVERSSVLGALGRIGKLSLKRKIESRVVSTNLDKYLPGLVEVLREAVNCRNHYVHGVPGWVDYSDRTDLVRFFTDALEFSFAASDLVDLGWDFKSWAVSPMTYRHPFSAFVKSYPEQFRIFKSAVGR